MAASPLVTCAWLAEHLEDPNVRILEISSTPDLAIYNKGHIPGAQGVYWKTACWHETDRELVTPEAMARQLGALGIGPQQMLVLYGDPVQYGTYAFWAFTMAGHTNLRLLDGSRKRWLAEGRPMTTDVRQPSPVAYPAPTGTQGPRVGRRNVRDHLRKPDRFLLDVRSEEEYTGKRVIEYSAAFDHGAERFGRIPGAVNLYYKALMNDDETFKSPDELRRTLAGVGIAPGKFAEIVCYCRLSHRATFAWFAMTHLIGMPDVKVYDGSWTEWGSIVGYPIEK
jgi:thiosulfate/3-mercaptopyruvate sulfurtransferase